MNSLRRCWRTWKKWNQNGKFKKIGRS